jgi:hypothetical protein
MNNKWSIVQTCKWCRKEIVKGWEVYNGAPIAPWMHKVGMYTCPHHPETLAEPADNRWENVYASISKPKIYDCDLKSGYSKILEDLLEVRIDVWYEGEHYTQVYRTHKDTPELVLIDWWTFLLDGMVRGLDVALDNHDKRRDEH